jgi:hypothetical protein
MYIDRKARPGTIYGPFTDEEREEIAATARPGTVKWVPAEDQDQAYDDE